MELRKALDAEKKRLDMVNLEIAKFRAEYGVSPSMVALYSAMGRTSQALEALEVAIGQIERLWLEIEEKDRIMRERKRLGYEK